MKADPWIIVEHGKPDRAWELSLVRTSYTHGRKSYGWFSERKLVVASSGGPCNDTFHPFIAARLREVATLACVRFNKQDMGPLPLP